MLVDAATVWTVTITLEDPYPTNQQSYLEVYTLEFLVQMYEKGTVKIHYNHIIEY